MKNLSIISLFLTLVFLLSACAGLGGSTAQTSSAETNPVTGDPDNGGGDAPTGTSLDDRLSAFAVVCEADAYGVVEESVTDLLAALSAKTGKTHQKIKDTSETGVPCEFLVGDVDRPETKLVKASLQAGDYAVQTVLSDTTIKVVLVGYNDKLTQAAVETFLEKLEKGEAIESDGRYKTVNCLKNYYDPYKSFTIDISDPTVIFQAQKEDTHWGHYQFPRIYHTSTGAIYTSWSYHNDSIYEFETPGRAEASYATSADGGKTWSLDTANGAIVYDPNKALMSNGRYFMGFSSNKSYYEIDREVIAKYTPAIPVAKGAKIYLADEVEEYTFNLSGREMDPETGATYSFRATVNWPYMPLPVFYSPKTGNYTYVYPTENYFTLSNYTGIIAADDGLYFCMYTMGVDSKTGNAGRYSGHYSVFVFHSSDCGRTWNYKSQVGMTTKIYTEVNVNNNCEGFTEPTITVMPDGSFVMLLRTGSNLPSYIVRSTDHCQTWSEPVKFDAFGVFPQLLTLDCGVTLAAYGRPKLHLRATSDTKGLDWEDPIEIPLHEDPNSTDWNTKSCFYPFFLRIDETTAMMIYSEFLLPNADGQPRKAILVRTIKILPSD